MYSNKLAFIVEGHGEYDGIPSIVAKAIGYFNFPIQNARGIGNITKNIGNELLILIKTSKPENVIVLFDSKDAVAAGEFGNCIELKNHVVLSIKEFLESQKDGSLLLPKSITVVIAHQTYDTWICSDIEGLKQCELVDSEKITETFQDVDSELLAPNHWIKSKLRDNIDPKCRRHRKKLISSIRPEVGRAVSNSLDKFIREVEKNVM